MNRNYLIGYAAASAVLLLLAFAAWSFLEIVPVTRHISPSAEARVNRYLALDRWLMEMGIPVRTEKSGDISLVSRAREKKIFIQASLFRWNDEAVEYLVRWVDSGGCLIIALDYYQNPQDKRFDDQKCLSLLGKFAVTADDDEALQDRGYETDRWRLVSPNYDRNVSFKVSGEEDALCLSDWTGLTRLVEVKRGSGKFIVIGSPNFLYSTNIDSAPNARLAWSLFAADRSDSSLSGCLFIRGAQRAKGLLGDLFKYGNSAVLLVSLLVLLAVSFWAVIPVFGVFRREDEREGKSMRERFLSEGYFLKRYNALGHYYLAYMKEIRRRLERKEGIGEKDIQKRILEIYPGTSAGQESALLASFLGGESIPYRKFSKLIEQFTSILERI
jgi:hypothetical protein